MIRKKSKTSGYHNKRKRRRAVRNLHGKGNVLKRAESRSETGTHHLAPRKRKNSYVNPNINKNSLFEQYYLAQKVAKDKEDLKEMVKYFQKNLLASIRVHPGTHFFEKIQEYLRSLAQEYPKKLSNGQTLCDPPCEIPWYPGGNAWRLNVDRVTLRKEPALKPLHSFLVRESQTNNITRQEEVSMIPPLLLDIEPHHKCLDMCASPGNKTGQMIEAMHKDNKGTNFATGVVVANDNDSKRAYMLHHQLKPYGSPNLFITCQDAQYYPLVECYDELSRSYEDKRNGIFDRILADVPCTGDGTIRKVLGIWENWDVNNSLALHPLQVLIGIKGAQLLRKGGLMVYSTCSLNPLENEAVVAQILRRCGGAMEIVDCSGKLPGLKRRPGLSTWKVAVQVTDRDLYEEYSKSGREVDYDLSNGSRPWKKLKTFKSFQEFKEFRMQHHVRDGRLRFPKSMTQSMWPQDTKAMTKYNLERCMRILPQEQDTGGFFICLLRKVSNIPNWSGPETDWESSEILNKCNTSDDKDSTISEAKVAAELSHADLTSTNPTHSMISKSDRHDILPEYLPITEELWTEISEAYGVTDRDHGGNFPSKGFLYYRPATIMGKPDLKAQKSHPRSLSLVSTSLQLNFLRPEIQKRLFIISAGVNMFKRNDRRAGCKYRVNFDGLQITNGYIKRRIIRLSLREVADFMVFSLFKPETKEHKEALQFSPGLPKSLLSEASKEALKTALSGSNLLKLTEQDEQKYKEHFNDDLALIVWIGSFSISSLISEKELVMLFEQMKAVNLIEPSYKDEAIERHFMEVYRKKAARDERRSQETL